MSDFERVLFEQNYNFIRKLMIIYCTNEKLAEEFTQEAFYKAFKNIKQLKKAENFKSWVYQIAINEAKMYFKRNKRLVPLEAHILENYPSNTSCLNEVDIKIYISELLELLEKDSRAVLSLFYFDDLSIEQIASTLNIKEGTVKSRLHRAREKFHELLVFSERQVDANEKS